MDFEVCQYTFDNFKSALHRGSGAPENVIKGKLQSTHFEWYFNEVGAKSFVVEKGYMDYSYLEEYAAYYVTDFHRFRPDCTRLHFFTESFDKVDFSSFLEGNVASLNCNLLQESYLGFLTIRALPETIFGPTYLRPPRPPLDGTHHETKKVHFPITIPRSTQLFGIPLTVQTLPFQEQDRAVSVCSSIALWTVFQVTGRLFNHPIPSLTELARIAQPGWSKTSVLPSEGLTADQMAQAIRKVGLYPLFLGTHLSNETERLHFKSIIHAFVASGIPVILGAHLTTASCESDFSEFTDHTVVVTGFARNTQLGKPYGTSEFLLTSSSVDSLYVHDDQVGPFVHMGIRSDHLSTSWRDPSGTRMPVKACPFVAIVPLHHTIRFPLEDVLERVMNIDSVLDEMNARFEDRFFKTPLEWSFTLTASGPFKIDVFNTQGLSGSYRSMALIESLPRFLWRATAQERCVPGEIQEPLMDIVFDATNPGQGDLYCLPIEYGTTMRDLRREASRVPDLTKALKGKPGWEVIEKLELLSREGKFC